MSYVDEWRYIRLLLDMIWIKVVSQPFAYQPPPADGCIRISTIHWLHAITLSFMWLYEESLSVFSWCQFSLFHPDHLVRLTHPDSRCLLN